jgi:hypothetical protein
MPIAHMRLYGNEKVCGWNFPSFFILWTSTTSAVSGELEHSSAQENGGKKQQTLLIFKVARV